jgi:16S rRNA (cytidine1402-2'-O)-methyltransferase
MTKNSALGTLYLIPCTLANPGETNPAPDDVLPQTIKRALDLLSIYIVENEKSARKFIKSIVPDKAQTALQISVLNKHLEYEGNREFIQPLLDGKNIGLISESGCPGIADPGAAIVKLAHERGIRVVPLVGPSSILLALMASGMNGQSFAFNGYLPIDKQEKKQALKNFERLSQEKNQTQLFIETPYRNTKLLEDLIQNLNGNTMLCVACDITLPSEFIKTKTISEWKKTKVELHNRPCIFILHKF